MSENPTKNANSAEAPEPKPSETQALDIDAIKAQIPKSFHKFIEPIIVWAKGISDRLEAHEKLFEQIETTLPEKIKQKYSEAIEEAQAKQRKALAEYQEKAGAAGGQIGALGGIDVNTALQLGRELLGGQTSSGLSEEITKQVIEAGVRQMTAGTRLLEALQQRLMTEVGMKTVKDVAEKATSL